MSRTPGVDPTPARSRVARVAVVGLVVVLTVLGWLVVDGTGPGDEAGPAPAAGSATATRTVPEAAATDPETGLRWVEPGALPAEARSTIALIDAGGPFPFAKDGATFGNRERLLPRQPSGYYREYTVLTPGEGDRGARRIVTGDGTRQLFWTEDHYASFRRVRR